MSDLGFIAPEPSMQCELCGAFEETRPYGPDGKRVCFSCGMKDEKQMKKMMAKYVFGESEDENV